MKRQGFVADKALGHIAKREEEVDGGLNAWGKTKLEKNLGF